MASRPRVLDRIERGPFGRAAYTAAQAARFVTYYGQYLAAARISRRQIERALATAPAASAGASASAPALVVPGFNGLLRELRTVLARDWHNIQTGAYRMPHDLVRRPSAVVREARAFFQDLPAVNRRRALADGLELREGADVPKGLPAYYTRNFHYQTDGYLSDRSARLYDHQVEVLFAGVADVMRRMCLVPVADFMAGRDPAQAQLLDVACGTGQFLCHVRYNWPALALTGVDLSPHYAAEARRRLGRRRGPGPVRVVDGKAEALPIEDASQDLVTSIYLFHELPRKIRAQAVAEFARVLKPGGRMIFMDSVQRNDRGGFDKMLDYFPTAFHEPYYDDYTRQDLDELFSEHGLVPAYSDVVFVSKLAVYDKPSA